LYVKEGEEGAHESIYENATESYQYERTFSFVKKPEDKNAALVVFQKDRAVYHPIADKVLLKLHRSSKHMKDSYSKSIPPCIHIQRRPRTETEINLRQSLLQEIQ
jgi:hypothetical protein